MRENQNNINTRSQTLIERFDSRISTHISALVAIAFGAFILLTFMQGQGFPPSNLLVLHLLFVETIIFPLGVFYCLFRSIHYSRMVEMVKLNANLAQMENEASAKALEEMPWLVKKTIKLRQSLCISQTIYGVLLAYVIWLGIIFVVLALPK
jgi:hypothetical protein